MEKLLYEQEIWLKENNINSNEYKLLNLEQTRDLRSKWREIFISGVKNRQILHKCPACNKEDIRFYDWHAFSYKEVAAKEVNGDFLKERLGYSNNQLYLIWEECNAPGLIMDSSLVQKCKWTNTDIYIYDISFKWTFVITHEGWFYYLEFRGNSGQRGAANSGDTRSNLN